MYPFSWHILELLGKFEIQNYIKNKWWSCKKSLFLENNSFSGIYSLYLGNNFFFIPVRFIPVFFQRHFFVFVQDLTTKIIWRKPKYYTYEHLIHLYSFDTFVFIWYICIHFVKFFSESQKRNDYIQVADNFWSSLHIFW